MPGRFFARAATEVTPNYTPENAKVLVGLSVVTKRDHWIDACRAKRGRSRCRQRHEQQ